VTEGIELFREEILAARSDVSSQPDWEAARKRTSAKTGRRMARVRNGATCKAHQARRHARPCRVPEPGRRAAARMLLLEESG